MPPQPTVRGQEVMVMALGARSVVTVRADPRAVPLALRATSR